MSNDRRIAGDMLEKAKIAVTTERGQQHGSTYDSFRMIADMWSIYIMNRIEAETGVQPVGIHLDASDVAVMMGHVKEARVAWGDAQNADHYIDHAGYVALAGMLNATDYPAVKKAAFNAVADALASEQDGEPIPEFLTKKDHS